MTDLDDIVETFEFFDDWEDRYRYLMELGRELPGLPEAERTDERLIRGCQSQVWLDYHHDPAADRLELRMDSDAFIVRGLISILLAALNGRAPEAVLNTDIDALFSRLDLMAHLSPTRGNGLRAMIARIREVAAATAGAD